jgi:hypothetical protein
MEMYCRYRKGDEIYSSEWLEHLAVNAKLAGFLGSILACNEGRQMKQCLITENRKSRGKIYRKGKQIASDFYVFIFIWLQHC